MIDGIQVFTNSCPEDFRSVLIVLQQGEKYVLVRNRFRNWEFPGGHREGEESFVETALRESREEAGAMVSGLQYLGYYILPDGHKTVITCAEVQELLPLSGEFETVAVDLFDELPQDLSFKDGLYEYILQHLL